MSYSRWTKDCIWYTFWNSVQSGIGKQKQVFEICSVASFSYKEITENIDKCLEKVRGIEDASEKELEELKGYMCCFINSVDKNYKEKTNES